MNTPLIVGLTGDILGADGQPRDRDTGLEPVRATGGRVAWRVLEQFPAELRPEHVRDVDGLVVSMSRRKKIDIRRHDVYDCDYRSALCPPSAQLTRATVRLFFQPTR